MPVEIPGGKRVPVGCQDLKSLRGVYVFRVRRGLQNLEESEMKIVTVKLEILVPDEYVPGPDILDDMEDRYSSVSIYSIKIIKTEEV